MGVTGVAPSGKPRHRSIRLLEKRFYAVPPQLLTTNGSANGFITIANASALLKVKQVVNVTDTLGNLRTYEVKRIDTPNIVFLGPIGKPLANYDDMSFYTTANGAFLFADEQQRTKIAEQEIPRAVYAEEPAVAIRSILVDDSGKTYNNSNPLPIDIALDSVQLLDKPYDSGTETYPLATREIVTTYIGGLAGAPVQRITLNYSDATKNNLINFQRETWNGTAWVVG